MVNCRLSSDSRQFTKEMDRQWEEEYLQRKALRLKREKEVAEAEKLS